MKNKLDFKDSLLIGSLLFGLFFGAGNLIFPLELGQQSGFNLIAVTLGFLITGVGLPILGVISVGLTDSNSLFDLAKPAGKNFAYFFTVLLYITIGPGFAIPRTSTVSYEVAFAGNNSNNSFGLIIFSILFFTLACLLAMRKNKLMDTIGKYLTPGFLILLAVLVLLGIFKPMGGISIASPVDKYLKKPIIAGLIDGYNTLDAPASLAFAVIIIDSIKKLDIRETSDIAKQIARSGMICLLAMSVVYASLAYLGSTSTNIMEIGSNGAIILAEVSRFYLGTAGHILLSAIVFIACLKTAIGLISACSDIFIQMFDNRISYRGYCIIFTLISFMIANLGLERIIRLSMPILMFIYPLSIVLMLLASASHLMGKSSKVYKWTLGFTMIPAIFDMLVNTPEIISKSIFANSILYIPRNYLPGFDLGFGWIIPAIVGFIIGFIIDKNINKSKMTYTRGS